MRVTLLQHQGVSVYVNAQEANFKVCLLEGVGHENIWKKWADG